MSTSTLSLDLPVSALPVSEKTAPAKRFYRPELDALRCLAFFMVLTHHIVPGNLNPQHFQLSAAVEECTSSGVCIFFMLSAFLITELLLREQAKTGTIHILAFYVRRILRIWPLYFLVLAGGALLPFVVHRYDAPPGFLIPDLLLMGNWSNVWLHHFPHNSLLGNLWSISVEEQFYLIWPGIMLLFGRRGVLVTALLVLPVAWATDILVPMHYTREPDLWCNSLSQFQYFAIGGLLALAFHKRTYQPSWVARTLMLLGAVLLIECAAFPFHYINPTQPFQFAQALGGYLSVDLGAILLLCAFLQARLPKLADPFIYLGKISYGMYLFHLPLKLGAGALMDKFPSLPLAVQTLGTWILAFAASAFFASLSYRYFEMPFLKLKHRFTIVPSRPD